MMRVAVIAVFVLLSVSVAHAAATTAPATPGAELASTSPGALVSSLIENVSTAPAVNLTKPEEDSAKAQLQTILAARPIDRLTLFDAVAYWVRYAIDLGIPANTIVLILLAPIIATLVTFTRTMIGLPTLDMLVPSMLAYAFAAVGIAAGLIILGAVVLAAYVSRSLLRRVPIMLLSKRSLAQLVLALFVFAALTAALAFGFESAKDLSIFPVLILMLLGDSIVAVQLRKSARETATITFVTIALGCIGYALATSLVVRDTLLVWPELVLLVIPVNFLLGRYFGIRFLEVFRFRALESYGSE